MSPTLPARGLDIIVECLRPEAGGPRGARVRPSLRDWTAALTLANRHWLTPAVHAALAEAGRSDDVPPEVRDYLALLHRANAERNQALRRQAVELVAALNNVEIAPMLLKGGLTLFLPLYSQPGVRMIRDLDVLIPPDLGARACEALASLGYRIATRYEAGHNAYGDFTRPNDPGAVDLHFEPIEMPYLLSATEMWSRARPVVADGVRFVAPSSTDMVLHHLLHAQIHYLGNFYRGVVELRQLYELALFVRHYQDVDWTLIAERFSRHRLDVALESYLLAAQRLFDNPWPLPHPASRAAHAHCRRCLLQLKYPALARVGIPWANIHAAFAWHRINHFYGRQRPVAVARVTHAARYIAKTATWDVVLRVLRTQ